MDECTHMANFSGKFGGADRHFYRQDDTNRTEESRYSSVLTGDVQIDSPTESRRFK